MVESVGWRLRTLSVGLLAVTLACRLCLSNCSTPSRSTNRNVWSAASPQAKCEDVTSWSAQMYTAFVGVNHSWPGWNALRSFPH
jgi:hypothetical protein